MILSDIWGECGRLLNDPNNQRWSQDVLTTRANFAQIEIQGYTNAVKTSTGLTIVASQRTAGAPAAVMDIIRVSKTDRGGSTKPLIGKSREEMDYLYPDWQQWSDGEPLFWWYDATTQKINLAPSPDSNAAFTNALTVLYSLKPTALSLSTDTPFDSNNQMIPFHLSIVHWVVAQCWMDDGTPEALGKAKFHRSGSMLHPGEYEKQLGRIMSEFDVAEAIPDRILWKPQGGRIGTWGVPSKSNPMA